MPATITADEFATTSVVVSNNGLTAATVPGGALLFRTTFSREVGYGRLQAPAGYGCSLLAAPVTEIECAADVEDTVAAGANRTFSFRLSVPSNPKHPSSPGRLRSTVVLDPDKLIADDGERDDNAVAGQEVAPPVLVDILPGLVGHWTGAELVTRVSSLSCSGRAPFGVRFGSMTCAVSLHPADAQSGTLTLPAGTLVSYFDVDRLAFNTLLADHHRFACSGSTIQRVDHPVLKALCKTTARLVFGPGESVPVVTWSAWDIGEFGEVDWAFCPLRGTLQLPSIPTPTCVSFGGSASSE